MEEYERPTLTELGDFGENTAGVQGDDFEWIGAQWH
ncbi:keywimysin-related RiPP [Amycolatopsis sp. NPDC004625]